MFPWRAAPLFFACFLRWRAWAVNIRFVTVTPPDPSLTASIGFGVLRRPTSCIHAVVLPRHSYPKGHKYFHVHRPENPCHGRGVNSSLPLIRGIEGVGKNRSGVGEWRAKSAVRVKYACPCPSFTVEATHKISPFLQNSWFSRIMIHPSQ
jgi:hypothetical protein